jgi:hypothetical protein
MSDEMVTLATFANTFEAEMAKNRLAEEGIASFLMGETSVLSGILFGEVRLLVQEHNLGRARAILEAESEDESTTEEVEPPESEPSTSIKAPDWAREPAARPTVDFRAVSGPKIAHEVGQSAGQPTPESKSAIKPTVPTPQPAGTAEPAIQAPARISSLPEGHANPGTDTATSEHEKDDEKEEEDFRISNADAYASRAWKAALIGFLVLPPLLHIYSLWCVLQLLMTDEDLSPTGTRKLYGALLIDGLVVMFGGILCLGLMG